MTHPDINAAAERRTVLNLDHDEARALHRIIRAMHDGECPKCHMVFSSEAMRFTDYHYTDIYVRPPLGYVTGTGWRCPNRDCRFQITDDEANEIFRIFAPFMERNLAVFEKWRADRLTATLPVPQPQVQGERSEG